MATTMDEQFGLDSTVDEQLQERIEQDRNEHVQRGQAFDLMTHSEGYSYLHSYFENQIKAFANRAISGFDSWDEYQVERGKIQGLKSLFAQIESNITTFRNAQDDRQTP